MDLSMNMRMAQKLELVMTPQLQQAIKLLQLSRVELQENINNELLENPVLETDFQEEARSSTEIDKEIEKSLSSTQIETSTGPEVKSGETVDRDAGQGEWEAFVENYNQYSYSPGAGAVRYGDDDMPTLDQTLASSESLADHLDWQLSVTQFTPNEEQAAERIIGNINEDGYLNGEVLPGIASDLGMDLDEVEAVLEVIQEFDPLGVGARDIRECLLIQARHYFPRDDLVRDLITDHLENLEKQNVSAILKALDIDMNDLTAARDLIRHNLDPRPGRGFGSVKAQYITPDVYIHRDGDEYIVTLNEDGMPKLRVSSFYESRIRQGDVKSEEKQFIRDKFRSAVWLIRSIHQRQNTIRKVTESIAKFQREFLDQGVGNLRPLILKDVADDIGMHESTISRVTTNKYVHTPQGIFELKYFFNSRISSSSGADLASESVKQRIKQLISKEAPQKPLSDQKICDLLKDEGLEIARRTVAKYREMLGILPSSKRKKLF